MANYITTRSALSARIDGRKGKKAVRRAEGGSVPDVEFGSLASPEGYALAQLEAKRQGIERYNQDARVPYPPKLDGTDRADFLRSEHDTRPFDEYRERGWILPAARNPYTGQHVSEIGNTGLAYPSPVKAVLDQYEAGKTARQRLVEALATESEPTTKQGDAGPIARVAHDLLIDAPVKAATSIPRMMSGETPIFDVDLETGRLLPSQRAIGESTNLAGNLMIGGGLITKPEGSAGIFAGRTAKTADQAALARAEEMASKGASREQIWKDTGWFQGKDGKWRFEISDLGAELSKPIEALRSQGITPLDMAYKHPELFKAYPQAADVKFWPTMDYQPGNASFEPSTKALRVGYDDSNLFNSHMKANNVVPHEIQHAIQYQEGFGRGAALETYVQQKEAELARDALSWRREMDRHKGDLSARDNAASEDYAKMGASDWVPSNTARNVAMDYATNPTSQLEEIRDLYGLDRKTTPYSPREMYRRNSGEVEARAVQARQHLTDAERRERFPWLDYDIPEKDQIVRPGIALANSSKQTGASALAMDEASRMARAKEMGFDTSRVLYHGTGKDFSEFAPGKNGSGYPRNIYLTDNPEIADIYANSKNYGLRGSGDPAIYPLYAKAKKPLIVSDKGPDGSFGWVSDNLSSALGVDRPPPGKYASLYEEARRQGYDQVQIKDMTDLGGPQTQYIPLKPEYIRSVNAAFDPAKKDSPLLLASNASDKAAIPGIALANERKELARSIAPDSAAGKMQAMDSPLKLSPEDFATYLEKKYGADVNLAPSRDDLHLQHIAVPKANRSQGIGTRIMEEIAAYADAHGKRVTLSPAQKDDGFGTTSRSRLVDFYKRNGYVENKGRNKDFRIREGMFRRPSDKD